MIWKRLHLPEDVLKTECLDFSVVGYFFVLLMLSVPYTLAIKNFKSQCVFYLLLLK